METLGGLVEHKVLSDKPKTKRIEKKKKISFFVFSIDEIKVFVCHLVIYLVPFIY